MENPIETLADIKEMMNKSSRFPSLSGWSGVVIGCLSIVFVMFTSWHLGINPSKLNFNAIDAHQREMILIFALILFILSLIISFLMTYFNSKSLQHSIWNQTSKRLAFHFSVPLITGVLICYQLFYTHFELILPFSCLFYGLSLFIAANYSFPSLRIMGLSLILLGFLSLNIIELQLVFWTIGFGVLHIVYGILMIKSKNK